MQIWFGNNNNNNMPELIEMSKTLCTATLVWMCIMNTGNFALEIHQAFCHGFLLSPFLHNVIYCCADERPSAVSFGISNTEFS